MLLDVRCAAGKVSPSWNLPVTLPLTACPDRLRRESHEVICRSCGRRHTAYEHGFKQGILQSAPGALGSSQMGKKPKLPLLRRCVISLRYCTVRRGRFAKDEQLPRTMDVEARGPLRLAGLPTGAKIQRTGQLLIQLLVGCPRAHQNTRDGYFEALEPTLARPPPMRTRASLRQAHLMRPTYHKLPYSDRVSTSGQQLAVYNLLMHKGPRSTIFPRSYMAAQRQ